MLSVFLPLVVAQGQGLPITSPITVQPPVQAPLPPPIDMSIAPTIIESNRLAITPKVDGKIETEEWDLFAETAQAKSYFQWEPRRLHVGASAPVGQDIIISIDSAGNGWLQGKDNLEVRIRQTSGGAEMRCRVLDNTGAQGPVWVEVPEIRAASKLAAVIDGPSWTAELTLRDANAYLFPTQSDQTMGIRIDAVSGGEPDAAPYLPRGLAMTKLVMDRGIGVPTGLTWKPEFKGRSVAPGESMRIRLGFNGSEGLSLKRIDMRTEGLARNDTAVKGYPFPDFDKKLRSFVDYDTQVTDSAEQGWRVLRGTVMDANDKPIVVQTSYQIAPLVQFDFEQPKKIEGSSEAQTIRLATFIRSNTRKRVTGLFRVAPPSGWDVESGNDKTFVIYQSRGSKRQVFEVKVPAGFRGTVPLTLTADIGPTSVEQTIWVRVP